MADLEVDFELNPLPEMEADFEISVLNNEHDLLIHRDYENQHPISAITGLTEALASGVASVEAEAQARQEADSALQTAIDNETSRATGAENQLSSNITSERQRALQAESALDTKIEAETARAEGAESALNLAITAEQTARENADESLQDKIDEEELRATTAESALNTAISNEVTRATSKENALETAINSEISAREQADTTLQENITAEETRAKGVENGLRADLTSEITARQTADNGLSADILAEKNRAEGVEDTLNTAIQNEVARATNAEGTIADDLSDEVTRATNAESDLETAITNETTRATTAEQANATAISNHIADKGNPHEVTKAQVGLGNVDNTSDANKPISNAVSSALDAVEAEINTINSKIPSAASSSNQLADKGFVNSSISTNTANFIGTFNSVAELEAYSGTLTNNDYAFVIVTDSAGNTAYDRYKYTDATTPASWVFEYELNNSSFTASQWDSINSTATVDKINQIATNTGNITTLGLTKQDNITSSNKLDSDLVDDSGQTNKFVTASEKSQISTNASNITSMQSGKADKATTLSGYGITDAYTKTEIDTALGEKQNTISDLSTIRSNATAGKSASDTIATYGNIVTHNVSEFATSAQGALADTAVQPSDLAEVATSGDYDDLTNKPTIPTVNNATLTIQKNSTDVAKFTANASSNVTANISVPTDTGDLTNNAGFITGITSSDVTTALGYTPYNSSNPSGYQTASDVSTAIANKADKATTLAGYGITDGANTDLSNLTSQGQNIANWSSNVTNCITEIPQDIKLELNNGTLTLKAGSKVYVPNGAGVFDTVTIAGDITIGYSATDQTGSAFLYINANNNLLTWEWENNATSGSSHTPQTWSVWYDTTNNIINKYGADSSIPIATLSFPIARFIRNNGDIVSIDQVFNGFGYIGSRDYVLPNVKYLIPDGRNDDGTLKSIVRTTTSVSVNTDDGGDNIEVLYYDGSIHPAFSRNYAVSEEQPSFQYGEWYKPSDNRTYIIRNYIVTETSSSVPVASITSIAGKITSLTPKTTFHALDYNDSSTISGWSMPSSRYIDLTIGAHSATYTAPANGWFTIIGYAGAGAFLWIKNNSNQIMQSGATYSASAKGGVCIPCKKGDGVQVGYYGGALDYVRFIYAEGENV